MTTSNDKGKAMATAKKNDDECNSVEAARIMGISHGTLRNWRYDGRPCQPPYRKAGSKVIYSRTKLERWKEKNTVSSN